MMNFIKYFVKKPYLVKYIFILLMIILCGFVYCVSRYGASGNASGEYGSLLNVDSAGGQPVSAGESEEGQSGSDSSMKDENEAEWYVYVCGCVNNPDVYKCREGARIYEIIELAGGFNQEADREYLNLVATVEDGQRIYVPSKSEVLNAQNEGGIGSVADRNGIDGVFGIDVISGNSGKVNINTADVKQLMELPGIGESRARDIVNYRNTNGRFEQIEDIMKVSGIKNASYERIKDLIKV